MKEKKGNKILNNVILRKTRLVLFVTIILILAIPAQLAAAPSFVGNVIGNSIPSNFADYWNQVTSENAAKWGSAESSRDNINWSTIQSHYDYARNRGMPYKFHVLVWGNQEPGWISGLSQGEQRAEVEEWISGAGQRFNCDMWDVVNEPLHAKPSYRNALGGDGSTGWDWVIEAFELANQYCSGTLLINEYGIVNDSSAASQYIEIINLLKSRGLVDGVGCQAHCFNVDDYSASTLQSNLDRVAQTGLPIYISEFDSQGDDNTQLNNYRNKFPVFYEHSSVRGITLWGYIVGQTWRDNTGLVSSGSSGASERPAMQWLKSYCLGGGPAPTPVPTTTTSSGGSTTSTSGGGNITVRARGETGNEKIEIRVNNNTVATYTVSTSYQNYSASGSGTVRVYFTNDDGGNYDVQIDYVDIDGTRYQAEDQATNTGVYQDGSCGGSYSEWLHCEGYIEFGSGGSTTTTTSTWNSTTTSTAGTTTTSTSGGGNITVRARGETGNEKIEIRVNNNTVATYTVSTSYQNYSASGSGTVRVYFTNDDGGNYDVQIDYVDIDGTRYQAEDQATNTGVYQDGSCGGSYSEWLHCEGYIEFGSGGGSTTTTSSGSSTTTTSSWGGWWWW